MLFAPKEKGQGLVEYALILVLVAIVVIAALMILGPIIGNVFSKVNTSLSGIGAAPAVAPATCSASGASGYTSDAAECSSIAASYGCTSSYVTSTNTCTLH